MESHYTLRRELPISMNAKQFFKAAQSELLEDLLPDLDVSPGEVIEIDDGLQPYYFYYGTRFCQQPLRDQTPTGYLPDGP